MNKTLYELEQYVNENTKSFMCKLQYIEKQIAELKKESAGIIDPLYGTWYIAKCGVDSCDYLMRLNTLKDNGNFLSFEFDVLNTSTPTLMYGGEFTKIKRLATKEEVEKYLKAVYDRAFDAISNYYNQYK